MNSAKVMGPRSLIAAETLSLTSTGGSVRPADSIELRERRDAARGIADRGPGRPRRPGGAGDRTNPGPSLPARLRDLPGWRRGPRGWAAGAAVVRGRRGSGASRG